MYEYFKQVMVASILIIFICIIGGFYYYNEISVTKEDLGVVYVGLCSFIMWIFSEIIGKSRWKSNGVLEFLIYNIVVEIEFVEHMIDESRSGGNTSSEYSSGTNESEESEVLLCNGVNVEN
jgi:hypothetical protein